MRILQLIDTLDPGGAERMAVNMANTFEEMGVEHLLVVSRSKGGLADLVSNPEKLKVLGKRKTLDRKAFRELIQIIRSFSPDILHAHGTSIYWGVGLRALQGGFKLVWHDHLGISLEVIKENPRKELLYMSPWIDLVITANESTRDFWISKKLKRKSKIHYLPNFPYLVKMDPSKPEVFTFLHLANFRREKGQLILIQAAKLLKQKGLDFHVKLVGKVVDEVWKQECESAIKQNDLVAEVSIHPAVSNVAPLLSEVHAGIVASDREGLPVALLEYGLASLPVVSTRVGQCSEVLGQGEFGILVSPGSSEEFAYGMQQLISSPDEAGQLGDRFESHVRKNYGARQFMDGYGQLLLTNFEFNLSSVD